MDVREKLVEMIQCADYHPCRGDVRKIGSMFTTEFIEDIVSQLIANGVTVQEWTPVKDRLPKAGGYVVCIAKRNPFSRFMPMVARIEKNGWVNPITEQYI